MQAGGQRFDPAQLHQGLAWGCVECGSWAEWPSPIVWRAVRSAFGRGSRSTLSLKKNKVCSFLREVCLFCQIVKRRYVWRVPGAGLLPQGGNLASEPSPEDLFDGLAGRTTGKGWVQEGTLLVKALMLLTLIDRPKGRRQSFGAPAEQGRSRSSFCVSEKKGL